MNEKIESLTPAEARFILDHMIATDSDGGLSFEDRIQLVRKALS